jgi:hypothetical protein
MRGERAPTCQVGRRRNPISFQREEDDERSSFFRAASRDVWREAPSSGRCRRSPQLRKSPSGTVTRSIPEKILSRNKLDGEPKTNHPSAALWVRPLDRRRP